MTRMHSKSHDRIKGLSLGKILLFAAIILIAVIAWRTNAGNITARPDEDKRATGVAQHMDLLYVKTPSGLDTFNVEHTSLKLSFNPRYHIPNWVAWELTAAETSGEVKRETKFYSNDSIPGCPEHYDYNYSGYDRGHMAPAGDMKWDAEAMHLTFCMANICPQAKTLNTGAWKRLEEKCRQWARADSAIVIACGPVLSDTLTDFIGDSRVAVPKRFFKVIISPYASPARGIAFIMPNGKVPGGIQATATTIDEVERITGYDFFPALPDEIETEIESQCDFHYWSTLK